ncbi:MAG: 1,4-alpha-glucan branching protein GlgB [Oscillospiraceae bacterium]|nr:1,4-alpha-glucan branching protein GlgB [Oscillospiraceae bacterium]
MDKYLGISEDQLYRYNTGTEQRCFSFLGAHLMEVDGRQGVRFAVWAPGVRRVSATGDFCSWDAQGHALEPLGSTGVWAGFVPDIGEGALYKYSIETAAGETFFKADPVAFSAEVRPATASRVARLESYQWKDGAWLYRRGRANHFEKPMNIYEVHLGSWKQHDVPREQEQEVPAASFYTYRELADTLLPYVKDMGYTHLELLPVMEHPFDGSWGYQLTGYFAATSRYGTPQDLMYFIDACHRAGIGVILDWVPGHFCRDAHGLGRFNGDKLYESFDHPQWGTYEFDLGRSEVRSFLMSSAAFWLEMFHADGIRVDGVTNMLYLNFGLEGDAAQRRNSQGGDGNLEAISFLREFNQMVGRSFPGVFTVAEESSAWPLITRPPEQGGLGFHYKWDMGWMNDTLRYMQTDFPGRSRNHNLLTFSMMYAFSENFILPLSHDEVVHGKCSLIGRMPGDYWRQFAGLRMLALYQMTHPGGKLNFMGNEIGQFIEWRFYSGIEWFLLDYPHHQQQQAFIRALNRLYLDESSLWQQDFDWNGYQWLDADNAAQSILLYARHGRRPNDVAVVAINFGTDSYPEYRIGVPKGGWYRELLSSDRQEFGGSGLHFNAQPVKAEKIPCHGQPWSIRIQMPPLGGTVLKLSRSPGRTGK